MTWTPGQTLQNGKYTIKEELGRGRFAITYLAQDNNGKELVIKTLDEDKLNQLTPTERNSLNTKCVNEGRKLERCKHRYVVPLLDTFMDGQLFCLAMDYIHGETLESIVCVRKFLPEQEALGYIRQIGEALIKVHDQALLHRDVKPKNIIVRAGQHEAVLIDFDLAGEFNHSLTSRWRDEPFAAIELNSSKRERKDYTDVYSLAATLYFLLTGQLPASALDRNDGKTDLIPPKKINPQISERVNNAILKGMELESKHRPQTMEKWLHLLGLRRSISTSSLPNKKAYLVRLGQILGGSLAIAAAIAGIISMTVDIGLWTNRSSSPSPEVTPTKTNNQQPKTNK